MTASNLSKYFEELEKTSSRISITKILAELFNELSEEEIDKAVYMMLGSLAPNYRSIVFNVAEAMMMRAISRAYNVEPQEVKTIYKKMGDLGKVAESLNRGKGNDLIVSELYSKLSQIAKCEGEGSQERKIELLADLLVSVNPLTSRFVARITLGKLRLGFSDKTVIDALSWMETGDKTNSKKIEAAFQVVPDIGKIAREVRAKGSGGLLNEISPTIGIPVIPMLAQRIKSADEMIKKMDNVAVEPKFDGLRVQIHFARGKKIGAFTRNLNDIKDMFPELESIGEYVNADSVILDSEAVGLDAETMKMADFQTTMHRRRKHDIENFAKANPLTFQVFDVMSKDGESFMDKNYEERRAVLKKLFSKNKTFLVDEYMITQNAGDIRKKHEEYLARGLEGAMIKKVDSGYVPGRTGWRWVKMKEVDGTRGKLSDTVDCVVMGYTRGKGKRADFGVGQFLAGVLDHDKIKSITKVGTGLTDEQFRALNDKLKDIVVALKPVEYEVHKDLYPDFWVEPKVVVELAADELTKSPKHTAGLALRFPRLVRFREDKSVKQITTISEILEIAKLG